MLGTASTTRGFCLVEEPGPWGPGAVPDSRLGPAATAALRATAAARSEKLLLVRRPATHRAAAPSGNRTIFRVHCVRGQERVLVRTCAAEDVVAAAADDDGWEVHDGVLLLVCTHGRKDWCCALRGRPLAQAVAAHEPDGTWECSHLGGCRFAANLLALPGGHAYGRVDAADAGELVAAVRAGRVVPRLLRGRCTDAMVVQAADAHARLSLGRVDAADLVPVSGERLDEAGDRWRITLAGPADVEAVRARRPGADGVAVEVRLGHVPAPQRLTCGAGAEQYARTWVLVSLSPPGTP